MKKFLTIDVGGTFTKFAVMSGTRTFKITTRDKIPTPKKNHEEFLNALADIFNKFDDVEGIALSSTGIIDSARGVCLMSSNLPFLGGHCLAEELQAMCSVPVTVENDANCAALAEIKSGCLVGVNDAFVRKLNMSLELDIDFDGTAADFAQVLEFAAIKILELGSAYVKI